MNVMSLGLSSNGFINVFASHEAASNLPIIDYVAHDLKPISNKAICQDAQITMNIFKVT